MNETDETGENGELISTNGSADINAVMDGIGNIFGLQLEDEVQDLAGVLNNDAAYKVKAMETAKGIASNGDWGYYAKQLAGVPGQFLKVWVRWNIQEMIYDYSQRRGRSCLLSRNAIRGYDILLNCITGQRE